MKPVSVLSNGIHIPANLCQLTPDAFNGIFDALIKEGTKYEDAYEIIEDVHIKLFGKRRYSEYNSFRMVRKRRIQK